MSPFAAQLESTSTKFNPMEPNTKNLQRLLPHGAVTSLAKKLGISTTAVSQALKTGKPSHPAVQEAVRMAQASGALATAQALAKLASAK
jgi:hypothetical protein